jgi:hypothetical protein
MVKCRDCGVNDLLQNRFRYCQTCFDRFQLEELRKAIILPTTNINFCPECEKETKNEVCKRLTQKINGEYLIEYFWHCLKCRYHYWDGNLPDLILVSKKTSEK